MKDKKIKSDHDWIDNDWNMYDNDWIDDNTCWRCKELIDVGCRCYESKSYYQACYKCGLPSAECNCYLIWN